MSVNHPDRSLKLCTRALLACCAASVAALPAVGVAATDHRSAQEATAVDRDGLDGQLRREVDRLTLGSFRGVVISARDGEEALVESWGRVDEKGQPIGRTSLFDLAEASSLFTGILALRLSDRGDLDLNTWLEDVFEDTPDSLSKVTLLDLMTGEASVSMPFINRLDADLDRDGAVRVIFEESAGRPGGMSNDRASFALLAAAIERITGEDFPSLMREHVFEAAEMPHATFLGSERPEGTEDTVRHADWSVRGTALTGEWSWRTLSIGSRGVVLTPEDLLAFRNALSSDTFLAERSKRMLLEELKPSRTAGMRYGRFGAESGIAHVTSRDIGFGSWIEFHPEDGSLIAVLCASTWSPRDIAQRVRGVTMPASPEEPPGGAG